MKIINKNKNTWNIEGDSGSNYTVKLRTCLDEMGSMFFKWECDCPSRKKPCKHVLFIESQTNAMDEQAEERFE